MKKRINGRHGIQTKSRRMGGTELSWVILNLVKSDQFHSKTGLLFLIGLSAVRKVKVSSVPKDLHFPS